MISLSEHNPEGSIGWSQPPNLLGGVSVFACKQWRTGLRPFSMVALIIMLSGCVTLPRVGPILEAAKFHSKTPSVYGPNGRVPLPEANTVIQSVEGSGACPNLLRAQLAVAAGLPDPPLVLGNHVKLLVNGPATFRAMMHAIRHAHHTIDMETYIFSAGRIGQKIATALMEKQRAGVQVNLIYDSIGSRSTPERFFRHMRGVGIRVIAFNPIDPARIHNGWHPVRRDHRKLLIIDGRIVLVGGVNVSDVYLSNPLSYLGMHKKLPWRDTEVEIEGPAARFFQKTFITDWVSQGGVQLKGRGYFPRTHIDGTHLVRALSSDAAHPSRLYATLISAIRDAKCSVHITAAYFAPPPPLLAALTASARRGIDVTLILPSKSDFWPVLYTGRSHYQALLAAGVKVYERRGALLHAKTAVIDGIWSTIGSTNLDWRSLGSNAEANAVVIGRGFAAQMEQLFQSDLHDSDRITQKHWKNRSPMERVKEWIGAFLGRLM